MAVLQFNGLSLAAFQAADGPLQYPYDALPVVMAALNKALIDNGSGICGPTGGAMLGYPGGTGGGGAVTQGTSRTTGVTLNTPTGQITLFTAAGSATPASFTVTNSSVAVGDTIVLSQQGGSNSYIAFAKAGAGSFVVTFYAAVGTASDAPIFNYTVIKGAAT